jgi:fatty-acyl-CoA synthase
MLSSLSPSDIPSVSDVLVVCDNHRDASARVFASEALTTINAAGFRAHAYESALEASSTSQTDPVDLTISTIRANLQSDEPINFQFTSGTTGLPKAVSLSSRNIVGNAILVARNQHFSSDDRVCIPVPMYHCFGVVLGTLACVSSGSAMVFPNATFNAAATLKAVAQEKCTALYGVPTMFIAELALPDFDTYDLSSLRTGIMAGSNCPEETMKRLVADMNLTEMTIAYGMTETSPVSFQSAVDTPLLKRVATVGRVHPHVESKVVDETGSTVKVGTPGELWVKGYLVMRGYVDNPEATKEAVTKDGWMKSGDLAVSK